MKPQTILNGAILFIGLGLAAYSQLNKMLKIGIPL